MTSHDCRKRFAASWRLLAVLAAASLLPSVVLAADADAKAAAPTVKTTVGGDLRLRNEYFNNAYLLDGTAIRHEQNYQRYRARGWVAVTAADFTFTTRLMWESWNWNKDSYKAPYKKGWVWSEGLFDLVNVTWKKAFNQPLTIIAGRQEFSFGDNFLINDGTPLDGSRTNYFDALRGTWTVSPRTTVDFIYIDQAAKNHGRLSSLNNQNISLVEQDERSGIVYLTHKPSADLQVDGYIIQRDLQKVLANGDNGSFTTVGSRVVSNLDPHWQWKGEGALQYGRKNGRDLRAWGYLTQIAWFARDPQNNFVRFALEGLSGDKPGTTKDEQFDMLWGRFPRFSEVGAMLWGSEGRPAQFGNLVRMGPGWGITPLKGLDITVDYNGMWALEHNRSATMANGLFDAAGDFRGQLYRAVVKYKISPKWSATLLAEIFRPGNYYGNGHQDTASFVRCELLRTF
ncbi:alginate export family protein [Opitutus sp. ER46]|uniref:alginate export family protein n=1 Tax=Opitutus sp. ER46 TaxID=2161864 RepID=UPI000D32798F|nr:alginate export family protein [Opitutus sp. ER46]PTX96672.1 hypothetical protein DB354_08445 [Opitutus sp. ER46]